MAAQSETDLYAPVKAFLESLGYEVKSEVRACDVVAVKPGSDQPVIVELKRSFGLPAVYQGIERLRLSDEVYIAVEMRDDLRKRASRKWKEAIRLCRMLGLGLMTVKFYRQRKPRVDLLCEPGPYRPAKSKRKSAGLLDEFRRRSSDFNVGGSTRTKLITAYRERALECAYWLHKEGAPLKAGRLRELTGYDQTSRLLQANYYNWFRRIDRGVYDLTDEGRQALHAYRRVIAHKFSEPE